MFVSVDVCAFLRRPAARFSPDNAQGRRRGRDRDRDEQQRAAAVGRRRKLHTHYSGVRPGLSLFMCVFMCGGNVRCVTFRVCMCSRLGVYVVRARYVLGVFFHHAYLCTYARMYMRVCVRLRILVVVVVVVVVVCSRPYT